jgi:hypothetical protein
MISVEDVAVTFAGVETTNVRPLSASVDVAAALTDEAVDVAAKGTPPEAHPVVRSD